MLHAEVSTFDIEIVQELFLLFGSIFPLVLEHVLCLHARLVVSGSTKAKGGTGGWRTEMSVRKRAWVKARLHVARARCRRAHKMRSARETEFGSTMRCITQIEDILSGDNKELREG